MYCGVEFKHLPALESSRCSLNSISWMHALPLVDYLLPFPVVGAAQAVLLLRDVWIGLPRMRRRPEPPQEVALVDPQALRLDFIFG